MVGVGRNDSACVVVFDFRRGVLSKGTEPESAEHVAYLTAQHEQRTNFPLISIQDEHGNLPAHFIEQALPGANGGNAEVLPVKIWGPAGTAAALQKICGFDSARGREAAGDPAKYRTQTEWLRGRGEIP